MHQDRPDTYDDDRNSRGDAFDDDPGGRGTGGPAAPAALLRSTALLALALWLVAVIASTSFQWIQLAESGLSFANTEPSDPPQLLATIVAGLTHTWGYLLVAVVAYAAGAFLDVLAGRPPTGDA